jgi:hypothetical protein
MNATCLNHQRQMEERATNWGARKVPGMCAVSNQLLVEDHAERYVFGLTLAPEIRRG